MIIATTVTITKTANKSQIRSIGADEFVSTFLISDSLPPTYFHYHHHRHHHYYYYYYYLYLQVSISLSKPLYLQQ